MNPLDTMIDLLRRHGWQRGRMGDPDTGFCLLGAFGYAFRHTDYYPADRWYAALDCLRDVAVEQYGTSSLPKCNDHLIASRDDAVALLQKASARFEEAVAA